MSSTSINRKLKPKKTSTPLPDATTIELFFRNRLRLTQLRMLVAIDERKQLRLVADDLSVTPPAISKQIAEIEHALQHPVLRRVGNGVEFTEIGALLARRARDVIHHLDRVRMEVDELCSGRSGRTVGIGAAPTVASLFLPALVSALKERSPNTDIRLEEGPFDRLAPMLEDGLLDIVVARETGHRLSPGFTQREVLADPLAVVCGRQHWLAKSETVDWEDLREVRWIVPTQGTTTYGHLEQLLRQHGLELPPGCIQSQSIAVNIAVLEAHPLVALMPIAQARNFVRAHRIAMLAPSTGGVMGSIKAVWRKGDTDDMVSFLFNAIKVRARLL